MLLLLQVIISDNRSNTIERNDTIIKLGLYIILTTDEYDLCSVYLSGNFNKGRNQDEDLVMKKIRNGLCR